MILYNTDMKIPISNTLYKNNNSLLGTSKIDVKNFNRLRFQTVNIKKLQYHMIITLV